MKFDKPIIGITMGLVMEDHAPEIYPAYRFEFLKQQYYEALEDRGAIVLALPNTLRLESVDRLIKLLDGLLLVGGEDLSADLYGAERSMRTRDCSVRRDNFEQAMVCKAFERKLPILGICRGHQMINVALGGSLYQDLNEREAPTIDHRQTKARDFSNCHIITISDGSRLAGLTEEMNVKVNSAHHQILRRIPVLLKPVAYAPDGVVEAVEGLEESYLLAVQWHPEVKPVDVLGGKIFGSFVQAAHFYRKSKEP